MTIKKRPSGLVWGLPGGKLNKNEKPYNDACREFYEETGVKFDHSAWHYGDQLVVILIAMIAILNYIYLYFGITKSSSTKS